MVSRRMVRIIAPFVVPHYTPHVVMLSLGALQEEGLEIKHTVAEPGLGWWDYVRAGEADIAYGGAREAYKVADQGVEERFIGFAQILRRNPMFLLGRSPEPDFQWRELEGKSIVAVNLDTTRIFKQYAFQKSGVDPAKVRIIEGLTFEEQVVEELISSGTAHLVVSFSQATGLTAFTVYNTTESFMRENPDILECFVRAFYRAQKWMAQHKVVEIAELVKPWFPSVAAEQLCQMIERFQVLGIWARTPIPEESDYDNLRDLMLSVGAIKRRVPYTEVANPEFAMRAVASLGQPTRLAD